MVWFVKKKSYNLGLIALRVGIRFSKVISSGNECDLSAAVFRLRSIPALADFKKAAEFGDEDAIKSPPFWGTILIYSFRITIS
jgi:hypothetical protein